MPGGRPTKLNAILQARIVKLLETGNYVETAAAACGVHKDTLYEWMKRGEEEASGPYREFSDAVLKAQGDAESSLLGTIHKSSKDGAWQAAAWLLERTRREKYALQTKLEAKMEHTGKDGGPVKVAAAVDITRVLDALRQDTPPDDGGTED